MVFGLDGSRADVPIAGDVWGRIKTAYSSIIWGILFFEGAGSLTRWFRSQVELKQNSTWGGRRCSCIPFLDGFSAG